MRAPEGITGRLYALHGADSAVEAVGRDRELGSASCPNFWLGRAEIEAASELRHPVEALIVRLHRALMRHQLDETFAGAEWWLQVRRRRRTSAARTHRLRILTHRAQSYESGRGLSFHFDKDEHAMASRGEMLHPTLSSILYLTGSLAAPRQSPTVLLQQLFDADAGEPVPENPSRCVLVFPQRANFLVFDGALGHGVLDGVGSDTRMTLLINWWDHQPEARVWGLEQPRAEQNALTLHLFDLTHMQTISRITPEDVESLSLSAWEPDSEEVPLSATQIEALPQLVTEIADEIQAVRVALALD